MPEWLINISLYLTYVLVLVAAVGFIGFEIVSLVKNFADSKTTLMGMAGLAVIFLLGYLLGAGDFTFKGIENFGLSEGGLKLIDAGLFTTYALAGLAFGAMVYDLIVGMVKG